MGKIFNDAKDKNVAVTVVYAGSNNKVYATPEEATAKKAGTEIEGAAALDLFLKGVVALKAGTYYAAVSCTDAGVISFGLS